ncbi:MAG: ATP-binding protein [Chloroflexota bacterium]|nr:ATP-binding protein [Chloroflexota bacterium]
MREHFPLRGIAARIALASLLVAGVAVAILAIGVLGFASAAFERLMVEHGETVAAARSMFEQTVTSVFVAALLGALVISVVLAALLAHRISRPLERLGWAVRRVAEGDYAARVARAGPDEIASLADSFNQMAERLEDQERQRREFIANAAHELRTPLTNLQGYLEALRDGVVPAERATFESLHEEADRLVRLSRSLDALAQGELATDPPVLSDLDLAAAIASAVELSAPAFERRAIRVDLDVATGLRARANPDHLAQVLANLLQNAVRYTPEGGRVAVAAQPRPGDVLVSVTNTGEGIPPADLPRVFERFYRVEKSRDRARGGAGIGLTIVKRLVELGGGRVGAESRAGLTRFWFSLPA